MRSGLVAEDVFAAWQSACQMINFFHRSRDATILKEIPFFVRTVNVDVRSFGKLGNTKTLQTQHMKKLILLSISAALFISCKHLEKHFGDGSSKASDTDAAIAAIKSADSAWDQASANKSAEGWLGFYADDAIMMPPGENVCKDKASREASIKKMFAIPGVSLRFQDTKVDVASSADMGYAAGVYQWASKDSTGKDYHETGKFCETWKKQADGNWKCIVDIWNADPAK